MLTPEDLAHFEESRSRAYELLAEASVELGSRSGPGTLAEPARVEALKHIAAAHDALDPDVWLIDVRPTKTQLKISGCPRSASRPGLAPPRR
jgi:hypothetical protein